MLRLARFGDIDASPASAGAHHPGTHGINRIDHAYISPRPATSYDMSRSVGRFISTVRSLTSTRAADQTQVAAAVADRAQRTTTTTPCAIGDVDQLCCAVAKGTVAAASSDARVAHARQRLTAAAVAPVAATQTSCSRSDSPKLSPEPQRVPTRVLDCVQHG